MVRQLVRNGVLMTEIGEWLELVKYFEGDDGNAWAWHSSGGSWVNQGPIAKFRETFVVRCLGKLYGQNIVVQS